MRTKKETKYVVRKGFIVSKADDEMDVLAVCITEDDAKTIVDALDKASEVEDLKRRLEAVKYAMGEKPEAKKADGEKPVAKRRGGRRPDRKSAEKKVAAKPGRKPGQKPGRKPDRKPGRPATLIPEKPTAVSEGLEISRIRKDEDRKAELAEKKRLDMLAKKNGGGEPLTGECKHCGSTFTKSHGRQAYCPVCRAMLGKSGQVKKEFVDAWRNSDKNGGGKIEEGVEG